MKNLFLLAFAVSSVLSVSAADQVTFTRHAYDEGDYLFRTFMAPAAPLATMIRPEEDEKPIYTFILLSADVEPIYTFSVEAPKDYPYYGRLSCVGENDDYIEEILVTQHLFNDDDLYEVIFRYDWDEPFVIYNEKGEWLGEIPAQANKLYQLGDDIFLYAQYENGVNEQNISALYTINKGGNSVAMMKNDTAKLTAYPNPVKEDEELTLTLPTPATADMTISVFSTNGSLLIKKDCKQGETEIKIPAYRLSAGVNPVVAVDADGNIISTGKIVRE
ncbi:MAG: hypothetical protein HDR88_08495 [Bacteroides sp.]|nr:hypothetical protein [Bacteroides sp.]